MKQHISCGRLLAFILACAVSLMCIAVPAYAEGQESRKQTVRVGWYISGGYEEIDDNGKPCGYYYDYLQTISYYTGWEYEFVDGNWSQCLEWLQEGSIDILCDVHKTPERESTIAFSNIQCNTEICSLYTLSSNSDYSYEDFEAFDGMKIAVARDSFESQALIEYARANGFEYTEMTCSSFEEANDMVHDGRADAMVSTTNDDHAAYSVIGQFASTPVYFGVRRDAGDILSKLNYAMLYIDMYYPNFESTLYNSNIASNIHQNITFTEGEKEYIASAGKLTMACGDSWYPFEYYDEERGEFTGISVEIMRDIAEISGLEVEFVRDTGFSMSNFRDGAGVNWLTSMSRETRWADDSNVYQTQAFVNADVLQIISSKNEGKTVALLGSGYIYRMVTKYYPDMEVVTCASTRDCVEAVADGRADCTFMNEYESAYYLQLSRYHRLSTRSVSAFTQDICFGISDNSDPMLLEIFCKAIMSISPDMRDGIISSCAPQPQESVLTVWLYDYPVVIAGAVIVAVILAFVFVLLIVRNRMEYRRRVAVEQANSAKTEFMSRMSHDIRTPMNVIIGMSRLAGENENPPDTAQCLNKINVASGFLLGLVNDVLDMVKVESGKVELHPAPYSNMEFSNYIKAVIEPLCAEKGINFEFSTRDIPDCALMMDKLRVNQVFFNLLSNAVKFTPEGGKVTVEMYASEVTDDSIILVATVADTGIGMSREFQQHMFDAFSQEEQSVHTVSQGTGLGLSIVRKMCELMKVNVEVESEPGKGTRFTLTGRFERAKNVKQPDTGIESETGFDSPEKQREILSGRLVLVSEDHPLNQEIIRRVLEKTGMVVNITDDGQRCVDAFQRSSPGGYSAILMDIRMPVMNGLEAARHIRAMPRPDAQTIPIIAMTANAMDDDQRASAQAGMNAHLSKPLEPAKLYSTLARLISEQDKG